MLRLDRIPKSFKLGPHTITVKIVTEQEMREEDFRINGTVEDADRTLWGLCDFDGGHLYVRRTSKHFTKQMQLHAFWHEYFHIVFWNAHRERLAYDETLVDTMAMLQLQAFQTMKN